MSPERLPLRNPEPSPATTDSAQVTTQRGRSNPDTPRVGREGRLYGWPGLFRYSLPPPWLCFWAVMAARPPRGTLASPSLATRPPSSPPQPATPDPRPVRVVRVPPARPAPIAPPCPRHRLRPRRPPQGAPSSLPLPPYPPPPLPRPSPPPLPPCLALPPPFPQ